MRLALHQAAGEEEGQVCLCPCGRRRRDGHRLDVDHTVEVQDGGLSVMDNLRTLCWICHKVKTAEMRRKRAEARKNPTAGQPVQVYNGIEGARHPIGR